MTNVRKPGESGDPATVSVGGTSISHSAVRSSSIAIRQLDPPLGSGRIEFDLRNGRGWRVGTVEIVLGTNHLGADHLALAFEGRPLAVIDRDIFREWLSQPTKPLRIDDVVWSTHRALTCLTIPGNLTYVVADPVVQRLITVT